MSGEAILLVRNPVRHDARVLRAARTLAGLGYAPVIVGVMSDDERRARSRDDGVPVERLAPRGLQRAPRSTAAAAPAPVGPGAARVAPPGLAIRAHRLVRTLDFYRRAFALVRRRRPALLHCNDYNTMWVGVLARLTLGTPVVYDAHELWADRNGRPEPRWWLLACEALFLRVAGATVTVSPQIAAELARRNHVAPPIVVRNVPEAPPPAAAEPEPGAPPLAVYVGGLLRHRGLEQAIAAAALVPGLRLRLLGPGTGGYREELRALADRRGLGGRLELPPPVGPDDVVAALAGASAGVSLFQPVCLSHELTLPNKLFEYLAAGLPVVVSDLPGAGGFVREHDVGEVVPPADPEAIAAGIRRVLAPERQRACREHARTTARAYAWERERERLEAAYRQANEGAR